MKYYLQCTPAVYAMLANYLKVRSLEAGDLSYTREALLMQGIVTPDDATEIEVVVDTAFSDDMLAANLRKDDPRVQPAS